MGSDSRAIYYSTIHLNRREEILVQSIISLYNSKNNYKWTHQEGYDVGVIIIGSEIVAAVNAGEDPFLDVKEQHIVVLLGTFHYAKNARAVVNVALPIKALDLVDKLGDIERNIISKPMTIGYSPNKIAVASTLSPQQPINNVEKLVVSDIIEFVSLKDKIQGVKIVSDRRVIDNEEKASSIGETIAVLESIKPSFTNVTNDTELLEEHTEPIDSIEPLETKVPQLLNVTIKPVTYMASSKKTVAAVETDTLARSNVIKTPSISTMFMPAKMELQAKPMKETAFESAPALDYKINLNPAPTTPKVEVSEHDAPILMDVASVPVERKVISITEKRPDTSLDNNVAESNTTEVPEPKEEKREKVEEVEKVDVVKVVEESSFITETSRRIKLLRWPKSEIIQRHPGNAILASMVINIPMSVEDMAKQSDLPLQICQNFVDAVIKTNVAQYIDDVENNAAADKKEEEESPRKGILYRIRAALGLLRK